MSVYNVIRRWLEILRQGFWPKDIMAAYDLERIKLWLDSWINGYDYQNREWKATFMGEKVATSVIQLFALCNKQKPTSSQANGTMFTSIYTHECIWNEEDIVPLELSWLCSS